MSRLKNITGLAGLWGLSAKTAARQFTEQAGVMRVANDLKGKRKYAASPLLKAWRRAFMSQLL